MFFYFSWTEILFLVLTAVVVGIIFSNNFSQEELEKSILVAGFSVVLHEIFHKIAAISLGYYSIYEISISGLLLGLILKLIRAPIIIFIPGYVTILSPYVYPLHESIIAFAGPLANLLLYLLTSFLLKQKLKKLDEFRYYYTYDKEIQYLSLMKRINWYLFIFNMIPLPPLDGFKVIEGLILHLLG